MARALGRELLLRARAGDSSAGAVSAEGKAAGAQGEINSLKEQLQRLVARLEQFQLSAVERSGDQEVVQYRNEIMAAIHETALGLNDAGLLDMQTIKAFDEVCLTPVEDLTPKQIREIRIKEKASQAVFARYLNVTTGLVSQWERGEKHPRGASPCSGGRPRHKVHSSRRSPT